MVAFTVFAALVVLGVAIRSSRQLAAVAAWALPMALLGLALVSAPDLLEQLLFSGSCSGERSPLLLTTSAGPRLLPAGR
ncbi:hypothetical protein [Blastococcus mobilis]|uniref:Uncharacterized protein n=1 Tax=Blastococcus mobilis TaxID=1938746 RepID=A0A238Z8G7_9ACTN|nr:hypothetical protein [Blastococcus mobilis]SNR79776.1 hypothetical protein SAMN06272737_12630 [Blastococcus mobilis]